MIFIKGSVPSSKNSKVWTGKFLVWSKAAQKYRKESKQEWIDKKDEFLKECEKASKPYIVSFTFVRGSKHKFDYINPAQTTLDLMVEYGYIADDNADEIIPIFEQYQYNKENPGVIIEVLNGYETY